MPYTLRKINATLKKLDENWNSKYWIFAENGGLALMKKDINGERIMDKGGVSQSSILHRYTQIEADGGDW